MTNEAHASPMSTAQTLTGIFFRPRRVFESFRERPRFLVAGLIVIACTVFSSVLFLQRVGYENVIRTAVDSSPRAANLSPEQKERAIALYTGPIGKVITYGGPFIVTLLAFAAGAAIYLLGSMAARKMISYKQALAIWIYSSLPSVIITTLLSTLLLLLRSPKDIDITQVTKGVGLIHAHLGALVDSAMHPVLAAGLRPFDLLVFYGLFLAALGLRKIASLSAATAWAIVLALWMLGLLYHVVRAAVFGG